MNERVRLEQLRAVLVRLEQMPISDAREWMLGEVRARAVDVETGVEPAVMRALPRDDVDPGISTVSESSKATPPPTARRRRTSRRPAAQPARVAPCDKPTTPASRLSPAVVLRRPAHESVVDLLAHDGVLSLDDQPAMPDAADRPWSRGLRG